MKHLNIYTKNLLIVSILSFLCIILYGLSLGKESFFRVIPIGILLSITSISFGGTLGFIFGLPTFNNKKQEIAYERSTSLKEIADWLTKIIVGVTLVELKTIIEYFYEITVSISNFLNVGDTGIIFSGTIMTSFFFIGFVGIYLLTITDVFKFLANNDKDIKSILNSSRNENSDLKIADLIDENVSLTEQQKCEVLEYVQENASKINDIFLMKRLAKTLFKMKEYFYSAELYAKIYDSNSKDIFSKLNEAYIRNKYLNETTLSNSILRSLIREFPNMAMPYYNLACNYNRQYKNLIEIGDNNERHKRELMLFIHENLRCAFDLDRGLIHKALKDSELQGVEINIITNNESKNN